MHLYVHHSNFTSGKCGANFNHFFLNIAGQLNYNHNSKKVGTQQHVIIC